VRAAIAQAPASFVLPGRVAERDVTIGGGCGGLMAATAAAPDVAAAALLADALPEVAVVGLPTRRLAELPAVVDASAKPLLVCGAMSAAQADVVIAAAAALGGRADTARPPVGVVVHSAQQVDLDPLLACARAGLACGFYAAPLLGGERPASRFEALVAVHAAALAACAAAQLAAPGAPYIVPALASAIEDHAPGFGLGSAGVATFTQLAQLAAHAGLPIAAGFPPTRPAADEWLAAADGTFVALAAALGGASLLAVAGHTDGASLFSPAQLVLDAETWSNVAAVGAGITVDDETLALETIAAVGIGGNALAQKHTRRHMRDVWRPRLFDRTAFDAWQREGRRGAPQRAATLADELVAGHEVPPLDGEKRETLRRIIQTAGL
jgi:trimethylamine--corrinoid protein Co-methyltransferase